MKTLLLIKTTEVVKNTPIGGNVDMSKYLYLIKEAQIFVIEPLLGTSLYNKILSDYENSSLSRVYETIYEEYVKPILIHSTAAEFITTHSTTITDAGIFKNTPENTSLVGKNEVDFLSQNQRNKATAYINRLEKFLTENQLPETTFKENSLFRASGWQTN